MGHPHFDFNKSNYRIIIIYKVMQLVH